MIRFRLIMAVSCCLLLFCSLGDPAWGRQGTGDGEKSSDDQTPSVRASEPSQLLKFHALTSSASEQMERLHGLLTDSPKDVLSKISAIIEDEKTDEWVRRFAVRSLARIGGESAVEYLLKCLNHPSEHVRGSSLDQLERICMFPKEHPRATRNPFGYFPADKLDKRKPAVERWVKWWDENKGKWQLNEKESEIVKGVLNKDLKASERWEHIRRIPFILHDNTIGIETLWQIIRDEDEITWIKDRAVVTLSRIQDYDAITRLLQLLPDEELSHMAYNRLDIIIRLNESYPFSYKDRLNENAAHVREAWWLSIRSKINLELIFFAKTDFLHYE